MCYNYNNFIKNKSGEQLVNKYKLRLGERRNLLQAQSDWESFKERFSFYYTSGFEHKALPVITMEKPDEIQFFHWGLIPNWVKTKEDALLRRKSNLNAKSETIFDLPSFKDSIMIRRCLVPATGFYEWHDVDTKKFPYQIMVVDDEQSEAIRDFCFGGIYAAWVDKQTGEVTNTFSIITTPANDMMAYIHNLKKRMPLILRREDEALWLRNDLDENEINELMQPYPSRLMKAHTIGKMIGQTKVNRNIEEVLSEEVYERVKSSL